MYQLPPSLILIFIIIIIFFICFFIIIFFTFISDNLIAIGIAGSEAYADRGAIALTF